MKIPILPKKTNRHPSYNIIFDVMARKKPKAHKPRWQKTNVLLPRVPTVSEELLFQTGAPELVVQKGEL